MLHIEERIRDLLARSDEQFAEIGDHLTVAIIEESIRDAVVASTTGTANSVDVVFDGIGQVVVDDMGDVGDVQTAGGDVGGHEHHVGVLAEVGHGVETGLLRLVSV